MQEGAAGKLHSLALDFRFPRNIANRVIGVRKISRSSAERIRSASRKLILGSVCLLAFGVTTFAGSRGAEAAWVRGDVRLNLRSGPGNEYRILGNLQTGDELRVLSRGDRWTKVRVIADGQEGFIPVGYLDEETPASVRVVSLEEQVKGLSTQLETIQSEATKLRGENTELSSSDEGQRTEIDQLRLENAHLKAGARWPEWITGALILSTGMVLGAILRAISGRGRRQRIKL
jgi:hypothetical protein